jgi:hypothetical protein
MQISSEALSELESGNKIGAIKLVCEQRHLDLKSAKLLVERYESPNKRTSAGSMYPMRVIFFFVMIAVLFYTLAI